MPGNISYSQSFQNNNGGFIDTVTGMMPLNLGVPKGMNTGINGQYIVRITSTGEQQIQTCAFLQEKISMDIKSHWHAIGMPAIGLIDDIAQTLTGYSTRNTLTTRRVWGGTDPLSMTLKLRFEAIDDVKSDVIDAVSHLQSISCPTEGVAKGLALIPPGPNPFNIAGIGRKGTQISIVIGTFLTFTSVTIDSVSVDWDPKLSAHGPVGAGVTLSFTTYEMMTTDKLKSIYNRGIVMTSPEVQAAQKAFNDGMVKAAKGGVMGMSQVVTNFIAGGV